MGFLVLPPLQHRLQTEVAIDTARHDGEGKGMAIKRLQERLKVRIVRFDRRRDATEQRTSFVEGQRR